MFNLCELDELIETGTESEIRHSELVGIYTEDKGNLISTIDLSSDNAPDALFYDDPDIMDEDSEVVPLIEGLDTNFEIFNPSPIIGVIVVKLRIQAYPGKFRKLEKNGNFLEISKLKTKMEILERN